MPSAGVLTLETDSFSSVRSTVHLPQQRGVAFAAACCVTYGRRAMNRIDRTSALGIGLAAVSVAHDEASRRSNHVLQGRDALAQAW